MMKCHFYLEQLIKVAIKKFNNKQKFRWKENPLINLHLIRKSNNFDNKKQYHLDFLIFINF